MAERIKKLLAYKVLETDENTGGIVFAGSSAEARRLGANEYAGGEWEYVRATRAQWADQYAPGPVPIKPFLENGWYSHCFGCEQQINEEGFTDEDDNEGRPFDPIGTSDRCFCSETCRQEYEADCAARNACECACLDEMREELLCKCPEAQLTGNDHAYARKKDGKYVAVQGIVNFQFPGCKIGSAQYRFDEPMSWEEDQTIKKPMVHVCTGDLEAWNTYRNNAKE